MLMKLRIDKTYLYNLDQLKRGDTELRVYTGNEGGVRSHNIYISLNSKDEDSYCSFELNKNTAMYLRDVLNSFVNEKNINIHDED